MWIIVPQAFAVVGNDFDADSDSDLLTIRNDGAIAAGLLNNSALQSFGTLLFSNPAQGWKLNSTGDFNADSKSDLLLHNTTTGELRIVALNGTAVLSDTIALTLDPSFGLTPRCVADFTGDGRAEILVHNRANGYTAMIFLDNTLNFSSIEEVTALDAAGGWTLQDAGDFNGDGKTDLLTFNTISGETAVSEMNGSSIVGTATVTTLPPADNWIIQETADFDGDGNDDILTLHTSGVVAIITLDGATIQNYYSPGILSAGSQIVNAGQYDSDVKADLLVFNTVNGNITTVIQDGAAITSINVVMNLSRASGWTYHRGKPSRNVLTIPFDVSSASAKRFLQQATWGPNAASIAHLKTVGKNAFLEEQFAATPSTYPDPADGTSSITPLREKFFFNAFHGDDQLRQRMMFALGQLFVVSANTVGPDDQLIPYVRLLHDHTFGNFYDLMLDVTLNPTMGRYLDMVNNDKTEPGSSLTPNENYARELLQLFTVGLNLLNLDGSEQTDTNGNPIPTYDEDVILDLSRVMTGWTYPTKPGNELRWRNPSFYAGPMEAVESHHDTLPKTLMNGFLLPGGQTALQDMEGALTHIFNHPNVGPFVATRLIRNLVTSNPSPDYIARVATVFNENENGVRGDLKAVLRAILLDPEAEAVTTNGGHLREPVLFGIALLRALEATVLLDNPLYSRIRDMGQSLFAPPSVFNYFSPLHKISSLNLFGPEFEIHTQSAAFARVNFVDRVVRGGLGTGASVDLTRFVGIADDLELIQAVEDALLHEPLTTAERNSILTALTVSGISSETRVEFVVYLIASSSRYQVQY